MRDIKYKDLTIKIGKYFAMFIPKDIGTLDGITNRLKCLQKLNISIILAADSQSPHIDIFLCTCYNLQHYLDNSQVPGWNSKFPRTSIQNVILFVCFLFLDEEKQRITTMFYIAFVKQ